MTTPTRSMARMAHSPPSPPPSAARLGQDSIIFPSALAGASIVVFGTVDSGEARVVDVLFGGSVGGDDETGLQSAHVPPPPPLPHMVYPFHTPP